MTEKDEIYFTKRIKKMGEQLIIIIPTDMSKDFPYGTLCKIVKIQQAENIDLQTDKKEDE